MILYSAYVSVDRMTVRDGLRALKPQPQPELLGEGV